MTDYPPYTVACFDPTRGELPRRHLDADRTQEYLRRLCAAGPLGLLIGASTGQGHLRTATELTEWFQVAGKTDLPGATLMALLRPEDSQSELVQMVEVLTKYRYQVAFVRPGTNLPSHATPSQVVANMQPAVTLAAQAGLRVGVYSIPDVSGVRLVPDAVAQLLQGPGGERIVAVKVTEADYEQSTALFLKDPRLSALKIVQGWDTHLARALRDGHRDDAPQRCGVTSGAMAFALWQYQHLFRSAEQGDWTEVQAAQQAVSLMFQAMQDDPLKFADLQRAKFLMGLGHPLTGEITTSQADRVWTALAQIPREADRQRLTASLHLMQ